MRDVLVDTNVILDLFEDDPLWADWSEQVLTEYDKTSNLCINPVIYAEVSIGFTRIEELEQALAGCGFHMLSIPKEALFLVGKAFLRYKARKGKRTSPLPDFFIGAHAAVHNLTLITRDKDRFTTYFPRVEVVCP